MSPNPNLKRLDEIYSRLSLIGADLAESCAAVILTGLQFTSKIMVGKSSTLSGGLRMQVLDGHNFSTMSSFKLSF